MLTGRRTPRGRHTGPVWSVQWAHPKFGTLLASCSYDQRVLVHKETAEGSWETIYAFEDHRSSVNEVAWAPHEYGLAFATASSDGTVAIVEHHGENWVSQVVEIDPLGVNSVSWAPFGHLGSQGEGGSVKRLVVGSCNGQVTVLCNDGQGWREETKMGGHGDRWVRGVAWAPNSGVPVNTVASCGEDQKAVIWTQDAQGAEWTSVELHAFKAPVWRVSWSLTGSVLAVSSGDQSVTLWKQALDGTWNQVSSMSDGAAQ